MRTRRTFAAGLAVATAAVGGGLALLTAGPAQAAGTPRYVATANPQASDTDNDCTDPAAPCKTIQYAVGQSDPGDTIHVGAGTYPEAVHLRISVTIVGAGATGPDRTTISGPDDGSAPSIDVDSIDVETQLSVVLQDLDVSGNPGNVGIYDEDGNVGLKDSVVSNNADQGIRVDGSDAPTVTIDSTDVSSNQQQGIELDSESNPDVTVTNSTVDRNGPAAAEQSEGYAGIEAYGGALTVSASTISKNGYGGVYLVDLTGPATITGSTLDGNGGNALEAGRGAAVTVTRSTLSNSLPTGQIDDQVGAGVIAFGSASVTVDTSTIADNTTWGVLLEGATGTVGNSTISGTAAGPAVELPAPAGAVAATDLQAVRPAPAARAARAAQPFASVTPGLSLTGTITAQNDVPDCSGAITDGGYNLADDDSCSFSATGSVNEGTAKLGPLADNGGPTQTLLPAKGSDAIDAIPSGSANCSAGGTDQRGEPRSAGPRCDIGAVEVAQPPIVITPDSLPNGTVGTSYQVTFGATGGLGAPYSWSLAEGSALPGGLTLSGDGVLSGTPTAPGTFTFTISVDDPVTKTYQLSILAPSLSSPTPTPTPTTTSTTPTPTTSTTVAPSSSAAPSSVTPTPTPTPTSSSAPLAVTGTDSRSTTVLGAGLLGAGLLLLGVGLTRRRRGRHSV